MALPNRPDGAGGHIHPDAIDFSYYKTIFKVGAEYFEGIVNIKKIKRGKLLKDVTKIRNITQDIVSSYGTNPKSNFLRDVSMDIISDQASGVNKKNVGEPEIRKQRRNAPATDAMLEQMNRKLTSENARLKEAVSHLKEAVFYIDKEKTIKVLQGAGNPIPRGLNNIDGLIHSIYDPGSPVKVRITDATEMEFRQIKQSLPIPCLCIAYMLWLILAMARKS